MAKRTHHDLFQPDVFDVLSASWVMACNDENPIITYEGIRHRLDLDSAFDIRGLIRSRGDLFRRGVSERRLVAWKQDMLAGKRLPGWIRDIDEQELRRRTIEQFTSDDVFRCQFRTEDGAPKASLEVIGWGLQHIDRLRRAHYEARETTAKSWQVWLVFVVGVLGVVATIVAAIIKK